MKQYIITEKQLRLLTDLVASSKANEEPRGTCLPLAFDGKRVCKENPDCDECRKQWLKSYQDRLFKSAVKELKRNGEPNS